MGNPLILLRRRRGSPDLQFFILDLVEWLRETLGIEVFPGHIPQEVTVPAISFFLVNRSPFNTLTGGAGLDETHVQFTIASLDYLDVGQLSQRLFEQLHGFRGTMGQTYVSAALLTNTTAQYEPAVNASDRGIHSEVAEFTFLHSQIIPTF